MQVRKYSAKTVPETTFVDSSTVSRSVTVKSVLFCENKAFQSKKVAFKYELGECTVGNVDEDLDDTGAGSTKLLVRGKLITAINFEKVLRTCSYQNYYIIEMPHVVGLAHSSSSSDSTIGDFKVVLPNGKVCPFENHGIPHPPTNFAGAREVGGILHLCGGDKGRFIHPSSKCVVQPQTINTTVFRLPMLDDCYRMDLSKDPLEWIKYSSLSRANW